MAKEVQNQEDDNEELNNSGNSYDAEFEEIEVDEEAEQAKIKKIGFAVVSVALLIVLAFIGFNFWQDSQKEELEEANLKLQKVMPLIAQGQYERALQGGVDQVSGNQFTGLESIANQYASLETGKTASFYAGKALIETDKAEQSISYLKDASASESEVIVIGAYASLGKAYEMTGNWSESAVNYEKAGDKINYTVKKSKYLYFAGMAYEKAGNTDKSKQIYEQVLEINVKNTSTEFASLARAGLHRLGTEFAL